MAVFRVEKSTDYTVMSNYHFKDRNLSLKAKGLLSMMLSLPEEWDYSAAGLVKLSKDGRDSVNSALKELETAGYLTRRQVVNSRGQFDGYEYFVYEHPVEVIEENPRPMQENPIQEKPIQENPLSGNLPQLNTNTSNTKESNTYGINNKGAEGNPHRHKIVRSFPCLECMNGISDELMDALQDFVDMRKKIKAPMTDRAMSILLGKLHKLSGGDVQTMISILNQSIMNSWKSVYPIKDDMKNASNKVAQQLQDSYAMMTDWANS